MLIDYADAIDTNNMDKLDRIFKLGAFVSYAPYGRRKGRYSEIRHWLAKALSTFAATQHLAANPDIRIDGDSATGKAMCFNPLVPRNPVKVTGRVLSPSWACGTRISAPARPRDGALRHGKKSLRGI